MSIGMFGTKITGLTFLLLIGLIFLMTPAYGAPATLNRLSTASPPAAATEQTGGCEQFSLLPPFVLADGRIGTTYRQQIKTSAQIRPPSFKVTKGRMPDGMHLEGAGFITGTPQKAGHYRFSVRAWTECPTHANRDEKTYAVLVRDRKVAVTAQAQPVTLLAEAGRDGVHAIRYLLKSTSPGDIRLSSSGGRFLVEGREVGRTAQPITIVVRGGSAWASELLTLRRNVMAAAWRSGSRKITYLRDFSAKEFATTAEARLEIFIQPPGAGGGRQALPSDDQNDHSVVPGHIVVTAEATSGGRHAIDRLPSTYPLSIVESFEIRALNQLVTVFFTKADVAALIPQLRNERGVLHAQPNRYFRTFADPQDDLQQVYRQLNLESVHRHYQGHGTTVAIIDTGVDLRHPDLKERVVQHANLLRNNPYRAEIHGTAVAGVLAAGINGFGISGVAPGADLIALRACWQISEKDPEGRCTSVSVSKALDTAIAAEARVVNMSFGTAVPDRLMTRLLEAGADRAIVFVAPVGNQPTAVTIPFPASHEKVLAVGGIDAKGGLYPNPILAATAGLCAPASNILTTVPGGGHNFMNGTSISAAIVSGIVAVAKEKNRHLGIASLPDYKGDLCRWQEALMHRSLCGARP